MIYKVVVAYDGYGYAGWQKQNNATGIQEIIEQVLSKIHKQPVSITGAGRTDAKVHAYGQVFHFTPLANMSCFQYEQALNTLLPKDIRIQSITAMDDSFHARFSAIGKHYAFICTYDDKTLSRIDINNCYGKNWILWL